MIRDSGPRFVFEKGSEEGWSLAWVITGVQNQIIRSSAGTRAMRPQQVSIHPPLQAVQRMLASEGLPSEDLSDLHLGNFLFVGSESAPTALVGAELYGPDALLRSLVVQAANRKQGLGSWLVAQMEAHARVRGVERMFLLTTTAQRFFESIGYRIVERQSAPPSIGATREFSDICPASSAFMMKVL